MFCSGCFYSRYDSVKYGGGLRMLTNIRANVRGGLWRRDSALVARRRRQRARSAATDRRRAFAVPHIAARADVTYICNE